MITYKIDQQSYVKANTQIRDMGAVLSEIAPTLRILQDLLKQHETSISIPSLNSYRQDLQNMIPEAVRLAHLIAVNSQRLSAASEQATKQLLNVDGMVRTALVVKPQATRVGQTQPTQPAQAVTRDSQSFRIFQRQA